jgi:hypothetical protein
VSGRRTRSLLVRSWYAFKALLFISWKLENSDDEADADCVRHKCESKVFDRDKENDWVTVERNTDTKTFLALT